MTTQQYYYGTGRRKTSVARVRIYKEKGPIIINGKPLEELMGYETWRQIVTEPLKITSNNNNYRVSVKVTGGGVVSQAGAISHGISRAVLEAEAEHIINSCRAQNQKYSIITPDDLIIPPDTVTKE